MSRQKVLVLGASGFIGRRVVAALAATDWACPVAASRSIANKSLDGGIDRLTLDATDAAALQRAMTSVSAVVSCTTGSAAQIVESGQALLAAAAAAPAPPRVVYLSSMAAYGSAVGSIDETAPLLGDLGDYSLAKATVDKLAGGRANVVRLRPGIVYGAESPWWSERIARLLVQRRLGDLGSRGEGICNLVHVDDVAAAVIRAIELPEAGGRPFNLVNPVPPTWNAYFQQYAEALGTTPVRQISAIRLYTELSLYGPMLKIAALTLGRSSPLRDHEAIRPWLVTLCTHRLHLKSDQAEMVLGVRFRSLDLGLEETAAWFLAGQPRQAPPAAGIR